MLDWSFTLFRCVFLSHYVSVWGYVHMCTGAWEGQKRDQCFTPAFGSCLGWEPGAGNKTLVSCRSTKHSPYSSSLAPTFTLGSHFVMKLSSLFTLSFTGCYLLPPPCSCWSPHSLSYPCQSTESWANAVRSLSALLLPPQTVSTTYARVLEKINTVILGHWWQQPRDVPFSFLGSEVIQLCQTLTQSP